MPIPDFQTIILPLLRVMSDGQEHSHQKIRDRLAKEFSLSEEELRELLPTGKQTIFSNRVSWAKTYLSKARLVEMTRRSYCRITDRGRQVLSSNPARIDEKFLEQFPEYLEFREREGDRRKPKQTTFDEEERTPDEILEEAYQEIKNSLA